jgi:hypothetical protein
LLGNCIATPTGAKQAENGGQIAEEELEYRPWRVGQDAGMR